MSSRQTMVGLDFGAYAIKAVWLERERSSIRVVRTEELQLPPETQDPVRFTAPWVEKLGLSRGGYCALSLPGAQTVFQPVALSRDDPRSAEQASAMEVSAFNEMAGETMLHAADVFDWTPERRRMLMALVRPDVVDRALRGAAAFGLRLGDLVPAPVAVFNAVVRDMTARPEPTLIVQIGHTGTDVAIGSTSGLLFARSFAGGGRVLTDAVARERTGVGTAQADNVKRVEGGLAPGNPLATVLTPLVEKWLGQLKSALALYRSQFPDESFAIGDVVLCGGGSCLAGLPEFVSERLGLPARRFEHPDLPPAFVTAMGLALGGLRAGRCSLSLLPRRMRDEIVFREKKPYWLAAGICASLSLAVFIVSGIRGIARERAAVETESRRIDELRRIDATIRGLRAESTELRALGTPVLRLLHSGPVVRELVTLVANSIHPDDWITMICDEEVYLPPPPEAPAGADRARTVRDLRRPPAAAPRALGTGARGMPLAGGSPAARAAEASRIADDAFSVFMIEGYTPNSDLASVKELIRRLLASPLVARADVLGDERVLPGTLLGDTPPHDLTQDLTHFVVRVEVNRP